jgi:large subunit ribosomal protein L23
MNQERLLKVLLGPLVSEKSTRLAEQSQQFAFKVLPDATKPEIKKAVEMLFDVNVKAVRVLNVKGKSKRFGRTPGRRSDWKKAYVRLQEGQEIDLMGAE